MTRLSVSWQHPYRAREFGYLVKCLPNGMVRVRKGMRRIDIPRHLLTIEVG